MESTSMCKDQLHLVTPYQHNRCTAMMHGKGAVMEYAERPHPTPGLERGLSVFTLSGV